jgi:glutathione S-transferase
MFLNSCLYPFAISLLSILLLFINNSYISQKINLHLKSNATLAILEAQKQQNMALISFVMFLPALWIYASFLSAKGAGDSGLIWVVASIWDSYAQHRYPNQKRWGYLVALLAIAGLWLGGAYGIFLGYQIHH